MDNSHKEIIKKLNDIFRIVFADENLSINEKTTSNDIDRWDSISLANIIYSIEIDFNIKIDISESFHWSNVGDISKSIEKKIRNGR
jgi:acyl carrier protein